MRKAEPLEVPVSGPPGGMAKATGINLQFTKSPVYTKIPGKQQQLMTTRHNVEYANVGTGHTIEAVHLPFGLLDTVTVTTGPSTDVQYRLVMQKLTGQRTTEWHPVGVPVRIVFGDLCVDYDFRNEDFDTVKTETGHDMRYRMLSAQVLISMAVELSVAVDTMVVSFGGANAIPSSLEVDEAVTLLAQRKPLVLMFPPLPPKKRFATATQRIQALQKEVDPDAVVI